MTGNKLELDLFLYELNTHALRMTSRGAASIIDRASFLQAMYCNHEFFSLTLLEIWFIVSLPRASELVEQDGENDCEDGKKERKVEPSYTIYVA